MNLNEVDREFFDSLENSFQLEECSSDLFLYDDMDSQSGYFLPYIYQPFDVDSRAHWQDRGAAFDFLTAADCFKREVLDIGPGDGWPSLILASYASKVTGVEGSKRRAAVCRKNAQRMGFENANFIVVNPGNPLPFHDNHFDSVVLSYSLEQTTDPFAMLTEIHRVLKPGGRMRMEYEALNQYQGGLEVDYWISDHDTGKGSMIVLYNRKIKDRRARHYRIDLKVPAREAVNTIREVAGISDEANNDSSFRGQGIWLSSDEVRELVPRKAIFSVETLEALKDSVESVKALTLKHPDAPQLMDWLKELKFSEYFSTHSGGRFAGELFDSIPPEERPLEKEAVDSMLLPAIRVITALEAPLSLDAPVSAVK